MDLELWVAGRALDFRAWQCGTIVLQRVSLVFSYVLKI